MATAARGSRGSSPRAKSASARNASTRGRSQSEKRSKNSTASRAKNGNASAKNGNANRNGGASANGSGSPQSGAIPFVTATLGAAAGIAGGVVLGRTALSRRRTDFSQLARQVGEAGRQFGKLAGEVHSASEKAAEVGKVFR